MGDNHRRRIEAAASTTMAARVVNGDNRSKIEKEEAGIDILRRDSIRSRKASSNREQSLLNRPRGRRRWQRTHQKPEKPQSTCKIYVSDVKDDNKSQMRKGKLKTTRAGLQSVRSSIIVTCNRMFPQ
ncbi:hypothetical protein Dimus_015591 [Dionaea muscipula]